MLIKKLKYYRRYRRCSEDGIEVAINSILHKYGIKREAYHWCQLNGVCGMCLMSDYEDKIHEFFILLEGCSRGYVNDENFEQVRRTHEKLLHNIDGAL